MSEIDKDISPKKNIKSNVSKKESTKTKNNTSKKDTPKIKKEKIEIEKSKSNTNKKRTNKRSNRSKNKKEVEKRIKETNQEIKKKKLMERKIAIQPEFDLEDYNKSLRESNKSFAATLLIIILILSMITIVYKDNYNKRKIEYQNRLTSEIQSHYNQYVKTNKKTNLYKLIDNEYIETGQIGENQELTLTEQIVSYENTYFKVSTFNEEYYVYYQDVEQLETLSDNDDRYKKYIVYNKNIITKDKTNFYDEKDNLIYTMYSSFDLPIIINKQNMYGVEFNNKLLYIKKEDIKEIKNNNNNNNTSLTNTNGIPVLNYHFFYDETQESERKDCNQRICHSKTLFKSHLEYIKENNIFTPTMAEFEMYLNKEINLPKSVLITIDDGWRTEIATKLLEQYQLNGTIFLITSWFEEINFLNNSKYVEYHSHGDNLHNVGICPGGQGGAIKCLEKTKLLKDLEISRKKLGGTKTFCYPFYEYNDYSISVLKEAGFTLAFGLGNAKATPQSDKYQIPRYVIYNYTTVDQLKSYID